MSVRSAFLVIEAIGFFLVAWTVMMLAPVLKKNIAGDYAPIAIRWSVLLAHPVFVPFTRCGINPAQSTGPPIVPCWRKPSTPVLECGASLWLHAALK
jgi:glycerol uptake facilitator-like aquaporin